MLPADVLGRSCTLEYSKHYFFSHLTTKSQIVLRLFEVLMAIFDYKARKLYWGDVNREESKRIRPHLDIAAITWPAEDDAIVKPKDTYGHRVQMWDRGLDEPGLEYTVATRKTRTTKSRTRKRKQSFGDLAYAPAPHSQVSVFMPPHDSETETRSRMAFTKSRRKSQPSVLSQQQESSVPPSAPPANPELARASRSNVIANARGPTDRSTLSSMQGQAQESDDDLLILDRAPPSWKAQYNIKEETVAVKEEPLAVEVRSIF